MAVGAKRALRMHARAFAVGGAALLGTAALAAALWPLWAALAWGLALAGHYLLYRSQRATERWAQERAAELRARSYDAAHIEAIRGNEGRTPAPPKERG